MRLAPGTRIGPYDVGQALGAGGMGEVYRARDTTLHRDVALKVGWRRDGRALFYIGLDRRLMEVPIQLTPDRRPVVGVSVALFTARVGAPMQLLEWGAQYVVSDDARSFLMNTVVPDSGPTPVRLIVNWKPAR